MQRTSLSGAPRTSRLTVWSRTAVAACSVRTQTTTADDALRAHHDLAQRRAGLEQGVRLAHLGQAEAGTDGRPDRALGEPLDHRAHQPAPAVAVVVVGVEGEAPDSRALADVRAHLGEQVLV